MKVNIINITNTKKKKIIIISVKVNYNYIMERENYYILNIERIHDKNLKLHYFVKLISNVI